MKLRARNNYWNQLDVYPFRENVCKVSVSTERRGFTSTQQHRTQTVGIIPTFNKETRPADTWKILDDPALLQ